MLMRRAFPLSLSLSLVLLAQVGHAAPPVAKKSLVARVKDWHANVVQRRIDKAEFKAIIGQPGNEDLRDQYHTSHREYAVGGNRLAAAVISVLPAAAIAGQMLHSGGWTPAVATAVTSIPFSALLLGAHVNESYARTGAMNTARATGRISEAKYEHMAKTNFIYTPPTDTTEGTPTP